MSTECVCVYCRQNTETDEVLGFELCAKCSAELMRRRQTVKMPEKWTFIYLRVSTRKQSEDKDSGLFIQMRQCIEYCFDNNLGCRGVYQDVHSGFDMRNTGLRGLHEMMMDLGFDVYLPHQCRSKNKLVIRLREAIKESRGFLLLKNKETLLEVNYIVVANLDRFGRDVRNMMSLKCQLKRHNIELVAVGQLIKTGTPIGELMFCQKAMEAELFLEIALSE